MGLGLLLLHSVLSLPVGEIVDRVECKADQKQSYALYLPSSYDPARPWPVILALDPAGRGEVPVEQFREAAEELGYLVLGSHNSHNGPLQNGIDAVAAMWSDAEGRLSVDRRRVYLAGFSGGAKMVNRLAQGSIASGVIACGAGLLDGQPRLQSFDLVAIAGNRDMNYLEVKALADNVRVKGGPSRFFSFDGDHRWPPPHVLKRALEWLDLQAIRGDRRNKQDDREFVGRLFSRDLQAARELEASGGKHAAFLAYADMSRDYQNLVPLLDVRAQKERLQKDRQVRQAEQALERLHRLERSWIEKILPEMLGTGDRRPLNWWSSQLASIRKLRTRNPAAEYEKLSQRLVEFVWRYATEKGQNALQDKKYERALYLAEVALLVKPTSPGLLYHQARVLALSGQPERALASLERALEAGLKDAETVSGDPAFGELLNDPRLQRLLHNAPERTPD